MGWEGEDDEGDSLGGFKAFMYSVGDIIFDSYVVDLYVEEAIYKNLPSGFLVTKCQPKRLLRTWNFPNSSICRIFRRYFTDISAFLCQYVSYISNYNNSNQYYAT